MLTLRLKILVSAIICFVGTMSFLLGWPAQFVIVGLMYLIASYTFVAYSATSYENWKDYFLLALPFVAVYGIGSVVSKNSITYPIWIVAIVNSFIGLVLARNLEKSKASIISLSAGILLTMLGYPAMKNWISFLRNPNPRVWDVPPEATFRNQAGKVVRLADMKGKTIVLDFWSTSCAPCIRKFPELEEIQRQYKGDTGIVIASIYLPRDGDKKETVETFGGHQQFGFQKLYSEGMSNWNLFKVPFLPYLVVIDRDYTVRYRGSFHSEWAYVLVNSHRIISKIHDR